MSVELYFNDTEPVKLVVEPKKVVVNGVTVYEKRLTFGDILIGGVFQLQQDGNRFVKLGVGSSVSVLQYDGIAYNTKNNYTIGLSNGTLVYRSQA
jgi:hypothetical protein